MMELTLIRMMEGTDYTLGRIEDAEKRQVCVTAERAWVDKNGDGIGDRNESRIPPGTYTLRRDLHNKTSPKAYECWEVCDVPGRSEIHIHIGNSAQKDSRGCPLVGSDFGPNGTVIGSKVAFEKLMRLTEGHESLTLHVRDVEQP